jgi:hypothetical protein
MSKGKINFLLDLDSTLISAKKERELKNISQKQRNVFKIHKMKDSNGKVNYIVFERPGLQNFLTYIFKNYNVSVWTAASKDYAMFIIENIVLAGDKNRKLDYVFFSFHCDISSEKSKNACTKDVTILWNLYKMKGYTSLNTLILDDYIEDVYAKQKNSCIIAPVFDIVDNYNPKDNFLIQIIGVLQKNTGNSQTLVQSANQKFSADYLKKKKQEQDQEYE